MLATDRTEHRCNDCERDECRDRDDWVRKPSCQGHSERTRTRDQHEADRDVADAGDVEDNKCR